MHLPGHSPGSIALHDAAAGVVATGDTVYETDGEGGPLQRPFSNFFTFILGSPFLLPQRANNGKGEFSQLPIWITKC